MVSAVLHAGADVNERDSASGRSPLWQALLSEPYGDEAVARRLVLTGVNVKNPSDKRSPLSWAVSNEQPSSVCGLEGPR